MIRLLLSLLALVSGLAVQGAPAQARLCLGHDTEIGVSAPVPVVAARIAGQAVDRRATAVPVSGPVRRSPVAQVGSRPGVLIGIDRARQ